MTTALEQAMDAWERASGEADGGSQWARGYALLVRAIADGRAVSPTEFAAGLGISPVAGERVFAGLRSMGLEFDESGSCVAAALTPRPTPHRVSFGGQDFYAWCALDTLFIPGLLDRTAEVRSPCAVSGDEIRLRVSPGGVEWVEPSEAVLSVVLPGSTPGQIGPESPT